MTKDGNKEAAMDATTSHLHLRFPARPEYLVLGRLVLTGLSRARVMEDDTLSDLKLALAGGVLQLGTACVRSKHARSRRRGLRAR